MVADPRHVLECRVREGFVIVHAAATKACGAGRGRMLAVMRMRLRQDVVVEYRLNVRASSHSHHAGGQGVGETRGTQGSRGRYEHQQQQRHHHHHHRVLHVAVDVWCTTAVLQAVLQADAANASDGGGMSADQHGRGEDGGGVAGGGNTDDPGAESGSHPPAGMSMSSWRRHRHVAQRSAVVSRRQLHVHCSPPAPGPRLCLLLSPLCTCVAATATTRWPTSCSRSSPRFMRSTACSYTSVRCPMMCCVVTSSHRRHALATCHPEVSLSAATAVRVPAKRLAQAT